MKKTLFLLFAAAIIFQSVSAQQPTPLPQKEDDPVIKISTDLIQIDVTVTDKNGKLVTDLTQDDFELYENGERQSISNFMRISRAAGSASGGNSGAAAAQDGGGNGAGLRPAIGGRTIAIVVDDLSLSHPSVFFTRQALKKFVNEQMQPGDVVAIVRTGGSTGALQQFTSDKRLLLAAIEKIRWNPFGGSLDALMSVSQNNSEVSERFRSESDAIASGNPKTFTGILTRESVADTKTMDYKASKNLSDSEEAAYALTALGVVRYIVQGMSKMPGRKSLMLFSDGIDISGGSGKIKGTHTFDYVQDIADIANRSSVVIYSMDTRGLRSMMIGAADNTYEQIDGRRGQKEEERSKQYRDAQDGLVYFAEQTGGKAFINQNDLNLGIERALYDQTGYYLIGYIPDAESFDASKRKFNKFEIKLKRPGLRASYRSGFFSSPSNEGPRVQLNASEQQMADALTSPFTKNEVAVGLNALYADDPVDGGYVRSFVHIDARSLTFAENAEGWKTATFDIAAVMFGEGGAPLERKEAVYTIKTKGATYDAMLEKGFVYVLAVPVKQAGLYQYRVALRDTSSGRMGSATQVVDIPDLKKGKLSISSLATENVSMAVWQNIAAGRVGSGPGQIQVPSTLLYDTVLKQYRAGTVLRYGFEVYNAKPDRNSVSQLDVQANIVQNNRMIVKGSHVKFDASRQPDQQHVKVSGNMLLNEKLAEGDYVLQIVVTDTVSKQTATQVFPFEIIK